MLTPAQHLDALLASATIHATEVDGCELIWQEWPVRQPGARPLLLLHGGFGSWNHWSANIEALSQQFVVWTVDLPGLGDSGDFPQPHTIGHLADMVASGWSELVGPVEAFDIAGFSFGAMVAGRIAADAGDRCGRCLLIGAVGFGELQVQVALLPPPGSKLETSEADSIHRENLARLMLHDPDRIDPPAVYMHGQNLARSRFNSRRLAVTNTLAETLPQISAKLVGIWGDRDATAGGLDNIQARQDLFSAAQSEPRFHVLPGVGHWAMYEAPDLVNKLILAG